MKSCISEIPDKQLVSYQYDLKMGKIFQDRHTVVHVDSAKKGTVKQLAVLEFVLKKMYLFYFCN